LTDFLTFLFRTLAFDYERLQFIADFQTTSKDPNALYCVSSRFQKFFLKNVSPHEINTRILRINGIIPSAYSHGFHGHGFTEISHNSLYPYISQQQQQQQQQQQSSFPIQPTSSSFSVPSVTQRPFPFYNYVNTPQKSYFPTSPSYTSPFAGYQSPLRGSSGSYFNFRGPASFSYESFSADPRTAGNPVSYPFQQLNAGESLPQFRDYRQNRFVRNTAKNITSIY
jgi:Major royal jelly protein